MVSPSSLLSVYSADDLIEHSASDELYPSDIDMLVHGTPGSKKGLTSHPRYEDTLQTSEVNKLSWAKEIEGKVSVFDGPVNDFLDIFVPKPDSECPGKHSNANIRNAFESIMTGKGKEVRKYPALVRCILPAENDSATEIIDLDSGPQDAGQRVPHQDEAVLCQR